MLILKQPSQFLLSLLPHQVHGWLSSLSARLFRRFFDLLLQYCFTDGFIVAVCRRCLEPSDRNHCLTVCEPNLCDQLLHLKSWFVSTNQKSLVSVETNEPSKRKAFGCGHQTIIQSQSVSVRLYYREARSAALRSSARLVCVDLYACVLFLRQPVANSPPVVHGVFVLSSLRRKKRPSQKFGEPKPSSKPFWSFDSWS